MVLGAVGGCLLLACLAASAAVGAAFGGAIGVLPRASRPVPAKLRRFGMTEHPPDDGGERLNIDMG
ncbi:MAG: hypothetical protein ACREFI_12525, partial [Stellaceae bacterium]